MNISKKTINNFNLLTHNQFENMFQKYLPFKKKYFFKNLLFFLFLIFPITFLLGNLFINLLTILIALTFIIIIKNESIKLLNDKVFYLMLFLLLSYLINLIFSQNFILSYPRVVKFFFICFFVLSFKFLSNNIEEKYINNIYKFWALVLFIVAFDCIFEFVMGFNTLGNVSYMPGRITSFTGDELVIGNFFAAFSLIGLSFIFYKLNKNILYIFLASLIFILVSFLIGERSNFLRTFIIICIFIFVTFKFRLKYIIAFLLLVLASIILVINFNKDYKMRYYNQMVGLNKENLNKFYQLNIYNKVFLLKKEVVLLNLQNSQYGAHYNVAKEIFFDNPVFGVGIKNFRIESFKKKYENLDHKFNKRRGATHPHQIHYELLAETGLLGYLSFILFIIISLILFFKNFKNNKNIYEFSGMLFVIISLVPLLPSGSFFSTYAAGLFWLNYSIMMGNKKIEN